MPGASCLVLNNTYTFNTPRALICNYMKRPSCWDIKCNTWKYLLYRNSFQTWNSFIAHFPSSFSHIELQNSTKIQYVTISTTIISNSNSHFHAYRVEPSTLFIFRLTLRATENFLRLRQQCKRVDGGMNDVIKSRMVQDGSLVAVAAELRNAMIVS